MPASTLSFHRITIPRDLEPLLGEVRRRLVALLNLEEYRGEIERVEIGMNSVERLCFTAGILQNGERTLTASAEGEDDARPIHETTFTRGNLRPLWSALVKLRYRKEAESGAFEGARAEALTRRIVAAEIRRGAELLACEGGLERWLASADAEELFGAATNGEAETPSAADKIPRLRLRLGEFIGARGRFADSSAAEARLDMNGRDIPNTQILIAGATGSGKTNLLVLLLKELRAASLSTRYPVHFLLFDYKGEFSDPANDRWLQHFALARRAVVNPTLAPLPFNPFKNFSGRETARNEINLYATELSEALLALDRASISANMSNRLAEAVIQSYKATNGAPIGFERIYNEYVALQDPREQTKTDSVKSMLLQLMRTPLFSETDDADLVRESFIVKMDDFPKDGILAKALVYFTIAKLNALYETLPQQAVGEDCVEIRHFTVIDEAHYMLDFDNKPLRNLIAVGRNKGLSVILATQNMESFRSEHFDFYANAEYPLIMRQQTMNDRALRDLFGVSGQDLIALKEAIGSLKKGELVMRTHSSGGGAKFRKIAVAHCA
jgi:energy-coupling factor transporter ATP-binding protein EcfA2